MPANPERPTFTRRQILVAGAAGIGGVLAASLGVSAAIAPAEHLKPTATEKQPFSTIINPSFEEGISAPTGWRKRVPPIGSVQTWESGIATAAAPSYRTYLPIVETVAPPPGYRPINTRLGVWESVATPRHADLMRLAGATVTRMPLEWRIVEPVKGQYHFEAYDTYLESLNHAQIAPILELRGSPWASPSICGAIHDLPAWQAFVQAAVARYPWVKSWEIFNEPDALPGVDPLAGGCFGDDPASYVTALHLASIPIRQAGGTVYLGGLAMEAGQHNPNFLDQILALGGADYFDVANIHYYHGFNRTLTQKMATTRAVMVAHAVAKPLAITELNGLGVESLPSLLGEATYNGAESAVWFCLNDWPQAQYPYGLLNINLQPRPAYHEYHDTASLLHTGQGIRQTPTGYGVWASGQDLTEILQSNRRKMVMLQADDPYEKKILAPSESFARKLFHFNSWPVFEETTI